MEPPLTQPSPRCSVRVSDALWPWLVGAALAVGFWWPLVVPQDVPQGQRPLPVVHGAGFNGGDTYNYFFALKKHYADGLHQGRIPLRHTGIGNGVSTVGESQTGVLYPFNLVAYVSLDLHTAYHGLFLFHYVLGFVFSVWLGSALGLGRWGSGWLALVFLYGWLPPRACLEWAATTAVWMPLILCGVVRWLDTGRPRHAATVVVGVCVQLLAGHFQLAWTTALLVGLWLLRSLVLGEDRKRLAAVPALVLAGYLLAAPQLLPTWSLKATSQRDTDDFRALVGDYGMPYWYLAAQWTMPYQTYWPDADTLLAKATSPTNKVEAHLFPGQVPLAVLAVAGLLLLVGGRPRWRRWLPEVAIAVVGVVLAEGTVIARLAETPGFGFFRYPGRYGILTQLMLAVLVGKAVHGFWPESRFWRPLLLSIIGSAMLAELYVVGHQVQYVRMVPDPSLRHLNESQVFARLAPTDRVFAPDGNTLSLSGAATVPPYLGLSPQHYQDVWPDVPNLFSAAPSHDAELQTVLQREGVTHLLTFEALPDDWPVTLLWRGFDPFLHRRWGRAAGEPLHLYRYDQAWGRAYLTDGDDVRPIPVAEYGGGRIVLDVDAPTGFRTLVVTDLVTDPADWTVEVAPAGAAERIVHTAWPAEAGQPPFLYAGVPDGRSRVVWTYRPVALTHGIGVAFATAVALATVVFARRRRRSRTMGHPPT